MKFMWPDISVRSLTEYEKGMSKQVESGQWGIKKGDKQVQSEQWGIKKGDKQVQSEQWGIKKNKSSLNNGV